MIRLEQQTNSRTQDESEDDKELQEELNLLLEKITGSDVKLISPALDMLKFIIRTSTTSMTSVPKPLKYLCPHYDAIKQGYEKIVDVKTKRQYADVVSILAMGTTGHDKARENRDCLRYCLLGTMQNIGDWGHEYIRQLEVEVVEQWLACPKSPSILIPVIKDIIRFDCNHNAEIQVCDMLMEIDRLDLLQDHIDNSTYQRICLYLLSCVKFVEEKEGTKILKFITEQYIKFGEYTRALIVAIQLNSKETVNRLFADCNDSLVLRQMAFIAARQLYPVDLQSNMKDHEEIHTILTNSYLSTYYQTLARELDVLEPKSPDEVYKTWLEPVPFRASVLGENLDSARQNLASSFVNGFVNAGFGCDKLLTGEGGGSNWIFHNTEHAMISTVAALGLLYLWDVDGGLTPIDKYLYSDVENIKAGALLALGIVNCRVRNECDPALALLGEFVNDSHHRLRMGAIFGLGLAYAGTNRPDVLNNLIPAISSSSKPDAIAVASLACGLIAVGTCNLQVSNAILSKLVDLRESETLKSSFMHLVLLGLGMCYMGCKDAVETTNAAMEVFSEPFKTISHCLLQMCAYAGTGDVLIIQKLLHTVSERIVLPEKPQESDKEKTEKEKTKLINKEWSVGFAQAMAAIAVAAVTIGEETGTDMCQRIIGNMGVYGDMAVRRAMPIAIGLTSVSKPNFSVIELLTKYAHDSDDIVSCNAIICLGIVGAGTNNARLAAGLRQLAVFHMRNPSQLFMVRIAQGLTYLGKGTLTISALHTDRQLLDPIAMAGLLIPLISLLDNSSVLLGRNHYLLYGLAAAMQPSWLLTLDESLQSIAVQVRVGQAVDIIGKAGTPKTITGIHTHCTPVLLGAGERAELATDQYEQLSPSLDGICILKQKTM